MFKVWRVLCKCTSSFLQLHYITVDALMISIKGTKEHIKLAICQHFLSLLQTYALIKKLLILAYFNNKVT